MPDPALIASLEVMLDEARAGNLVGLFAVALESSGDYSCCYHADDFEDLLVQVRTEVIRAQLDAADAADPRLN